MLLSACISVSLAYAVHQILKDAKAMKMSFFQYGKYLEDGKNMVKTKLMNKMDIYYPIAKTQNVKSAYLHISSIIAA